VVSGKREKLGEGNKGPPPESNAGLATEIKGGKPFNKGSVRGVTVTISRERVAIIWRGEDPREETRGSASFH